MVVPIMGYSEMSNYVIWSTEEDEQGGDSSDDSKWLNSGSMNFADLGGLRVSLTHCFFAE